MIDLPATYARIVAKRPELAVTHVHRWTATGRHHWYRSPISSGGEHQEIPDWLAESAILAHWLKMLPEGHGLHRALDNPNPRYYVYGGEMPRESHGDSPLAALAALAAFWEAH